MSETESVNLPKISELNQNTPHDIPDDEPTTSEAAACGRPRKDFATCSKQSQRRRLKMLVQFDESAVRSLRETSDLGTSEVKADEVLSLITEAKLTKHQMTEIPHANFLRIQRCLLKLPVFSNALLKGVEFFWSVCHLATI